MQPDRRMIEEGKRGRTLWRMRRGRATLHQRLHTTSTLFIRGKNEKVWSGRGHSSCTLSHTGLQPPDLRSSSHHLKKFPRYIMAPLDRLVFSGAFMWNTQLNLHFTLNCEILKIDNWNLSDAKKHFLLHPHIHLIPGGSITTFHYYNNEASMTDKWLKNNCIRDKFNDPFAEKCPCSSIFCVGCMNIFHTSVFHFYSVAPPSFCPYQRI